MAARRRAWCFTLNNPTETEKIALVDALEAAAESGGRGVAGDEIGESGTPHIQGYVEFKHAVTLTSCKKRLGSERYHLEVRRGTPFEAWSYCTKDGEFIELGTPPLEDEDPNDSWGMALRMLEEGGTVLDVLRKWPGHIRSIGALERAKVAIENTEAGVWRNLEVTYISGEPGCGKTRMVMENEGYGAVYRVRKGNNPWDGYDGQEVVLFDEFRSDFKLAAMLEWLDGYPVALPARYTDKQAKFTRVYIVSNWTLGEQYPSVQENDTVTWEAFLRRIHQVFTMDAEGALHPIRKP